MIRTLSIRNHGSNHKIDIDLDERITCLTGESYTGKSWVVRAVKWLALNRPAGTSFIRWGTKRSTVSAGTDKHTVTRRRSKTENIYIVDGTSLKAFGNNVPAKVQKILNLSDLNFQTQQEMPHGAGPLFWFALSPGEVAKRLNKIVNLDLIDRTLGNLGKAVHRSKVELDICRDRRKEARERAEELSFVDEMVQEWEEIKDIQEQIRKVKHDYRALEEALLHVIWDQKEVKKTRQVSNEIIPELEHLEALRAEIIREWEQYQELAHMIGNIERGEKARAEALEELTHAQSDYVKAMKGRCPLCGRK